MKTELEHEKHMMKKMIKGSVKKKTKSIIKGPKCGQCEDHNATVVSANYLKTYFIFKVARKQPNVGDMEDYVCTILF